ncbi:unnamed protein product [Diplocarpon coronariae]|uniref:Uncharacterized protein n=1 Tax=Diplocarpon coronariae TaxID=2795749 RepID=A0A218YV18_9HELO|nr:hypothetical protein B2J93_7004 [Marssonina coronariae]
MASRPKSRSKEAQLSRKPSRLPNPKASGPAAAPAATSRSLPHTIETINPKLPIDGTIDVVEHDSSAASTTLGPVLQRASFSISLKALPASIASTYSGPSRQVVTGYTVASVHLWLSVFHNAVTAAQHLLPIEEVWYALAFGLHHGLPLHRLNPWFETWWAKMFPLLGTLRSDVLRSLLYPCYELGGAAKLDFVVKRLWQLTGDLGESNPSRYAELRVPKNVIEWAEEQAKADDPGGSV